MRGTYLRLIYLYQLSRNLTHSFLQPAMLRCIAHGKVPLSNIIRGHLSDRVGQQSVSYTTYTIFNNQLRRPKTRCKAIVPKV